MNERTVYTLAGTGMWAGSLQELHRAAIQSPFKFFSNMETLNLGTSIYGCFNGRSEGPYYLSFSVRRDLAIGPSQGGNIIFSCTSYAPEVNIGVREGLEQALGTPLNLPIASATAARLEEVGKDLFPEMVRRPADAIRELTGLEPN